MIYHAYENGFRTLGRQTLLEPIEWTQDGWFKAMGGKLSTPIAKPTSSVGNQSGMALSDDFSHNRFGNQWCFHNPGPIDMARVSFANTQLILEASGQSPADSSPITCVAVDRSYQVEISLSLSAEAEAGLLLFYNHKAFVGFGADGKVLKSFQYAEEQQWARMGMPVRDIRLRLINDNHVVTYEYSVDKGKSWQRHPTRMEVSGMNHNVFGGFLSLKIAIYCAGKGKVILSNFSYRAI
ncbi:hypothetical protein AX660_09355 [Paraglaciecola hydrolytica]|uniref:Beta-xylosidase C-terminal Concanavalin A-like domain-containing protein n=2 Tax=Paraglaciecola hydrolytica TaxID=1799789 RepID=A0A136A4N9_9ALTE|nr:hypothetical protein AX660_09355 [Paraglaciecola hydrolytica]